MHAPLMAVVRSLCLRILHSRVGRGRNNATFSSLASAVICAGQPKAAQNKKGHFVRNDPLMPKTGKKNGVP